MKKSPSIYTLKNLLKVVNSVGVQLADGRYVPARPIGWSGLRNRFRCAMQVFTGNADAVLWPEDEPANKVSGPTP